MYRSEWRREDAVAAVERKKSITVNDNTATYPSDAAVLQGSSI
jgi:hypothetical protein